MGRVSTVEINGRKYDASTGKLVKQAQTQSRGASIDGFTKPKNANQLHKVTSKSKTLDRKAVSSTKNQITAKSAAQPKVISRKQQAKSHAATVDPQRQKKAASVSRSRLISKFSKPAVSSQQTASSSVKQVSQPAPTQATKLMSSEYYSTESNKEKTRSAKKKKNRRFSGFKFNAPKARSVFAASFLVVAIAGYITYLNIPNLSLKIAASRAGIDATMPGYKPSGFAMSGPINYSQGLVTISFKSNSDDRQFSVAERSSSWDSESLLANYVEKETPDYVTFQDKGLTIYVYDGSNATWVDGGIWYTIEGESQLNSDQLLKIAASM